MWVVYCWIDKGLVTAQKRKPDRRRDRSQTAEVQTLLVSPFQPELNKVQYEGRIEMPNGLSLPLGFAMYTLLMGSGW